VHGYINCSRAMGRYHSLEEYRGAAANAWGAGADGVYLFNLPCLDELAFLTPVPVDRPPFPPPEFSPQCGHPDLDRARQALVELGDPQALAHADKRMLFYTDPPRYRHYPQEVAAISRLASEPAELVWRCYEDLERAEVTIELKLVGITIHDEFAFALNGEPVEAERIERLHSANGRDARIHSIPLAPYSQYTIRPRAEWLRRGENTLAVTLVEREPDLMGEIEVREMEVEASYD